jgi:hypothetical protein
LVKVNVGTKRVVVALDGSMTTLQTVARATYYADFISTLKQTHKRGGNCAAIDHCMSCLRTFKAGDDAHRRLSVVLWVRGM